MKKTYIITFLTCAVSIALVLMLTCVFRRDADSTVKVGFIYVGDASTGYTGNFIAAQKELETLYQDRVEIAKSLFGILPVNADLEAARE